MSRLLEDRHGEFREYPPGVITFFPPASCEDGILTAAHHVLGLFQPGRIHYMTYKTIRVEILPDDSAEILAVRWEAYKSCSNREALHNIRVIEGGKLVKPSTFYGFRLPDHRGDKFYQEHAGVLVE
jgi:hypothetical protein